MIVTVTLSPSLDRTLGVAELTRVAGFLHGGGAGAEALRVDIAWSTATVQTAGAGVPPADLIDIDAVEVSPIQTPTG